MTFAVAHSVEYDRVAALPCRVPSVPDAQAWATVLSPLMRLTGSDAALLPWQGQALAEWMDLEGLMWFAPVGSGKTLVSYLAPIAVESARSLIVVPASLKDKTLSDFSAYQGVWRRPTGVMRTVSFHELQRDPLLVASYKPDTIIIDESDDLSNPESSMTRRLDRYIREADVRVMAMSGTPSRKSILNYWHLLCWTLGDLAPVPLIKSEAQMWAFVLDDRRNMRVPRPGPLGATQKAARAWFAKRLRETPGVLINDFDSCSAPLRVRQRLARECPAIDDAFERFYTTFETPGGMVVSDPLSRWRLDGQLGCGLYTYWDPPPPDRWRDARRNVARFVRRMIDNSTRSHNPLDTELQVLRRYPEAPEVIEWQSCRELYDERKHTRAEWISDATIKSALDWLREIDEPGIVWCGSAHFGPELARLARLRYYGPGGKSADGSALHVAPVGRNMIASWNANKKGFNLQAWPRQLLVMPPQSAKWLEQIFGRSHRRGALEEVVVDILMASGGTFDAFDAALAEARGIKARESLTQKILRAKIERVKPPGGQRWARRT